MNAINTIEKGSIINETPSQNPPSNNFFITSLPDCKLYIFRKKRRCNKNIISSLCDEKQDNINVSRRANNKKA